MRAGRDSFTITALSKEHFSAFGRILISAGRVKFNFYLSLSECMGKVLMFGFSTQNNTLLSTNIDLINLNYLNIGYV